jgi:hypothetical protein
MDSMTICTNRDARFPFRASNAMDASLILLEFGSMALSAGRWCAGRLYRFGMRKIRETFVTIGALHILVHRPLKDLLIVMAGETCGLVLTQHYRRE